jgi:hypothetical protein
MMDERTYDIALIDRAAASMTYPATPQLRGRVLAAIASAAEPAAPRRRPALSLASAAAAVALFGAMLALAVPSSRSAIAEFFGIEGSDVEVLPSPPPGTTATPFPTPADLPPTARAIALDDLDDAVGFDVALPDDAGDPHRSYMVTYMAERMAILQYPGFDLWEAQLASGLVAGKGVAPGTRVEEFELREGVPARWISGAPHLIAFRTADGTEIEESIRTVRRSTLIWRTDHAFYRIETDLPLDDAREIANTLP